MTTIVQDAFARFIRNHQLASTVESELRQAFEAGYAAGLRHDQNMKTRPRTKERATKPPKIKPPEARIDPLLRRLKDSE